MTLSDVAKGTAGVVGFAAAITGILAAVGVIGGSSDATGALAEAAQKTTDAGSSSVSLEIEAHQGSQLVGLQKANGSIDFIEEVGRLDFTSGVKEILLKPYIYLSPAQGPAAGVWCQYDATTLGSGFLFGAITGFRSDPAAALENLEQNGTYEKVGTEQLFGVETTHYTGRFQPAKLLEGEQDPIRRRLLEGVARYNHDLPVQVWIGNDDLPRRIEATFSLPGGNGELIQLKATFDFSDFGVQVVADPPPRANTFEPGVRGCPRNPFSAQPAPTQ